MLLRFIIKISFIVTAAFTVFSFAASLLGTAHSPNLVLIGFTEGCQDKPRPCWYGIIPGKTPVGIGQSILKNLNFEFTDQYPLDATYSDQVYRNRDFPCIQIEFGITSKHPNLIDTLWLDSCGAVSLGDVTTFLGEPDQLNLSGLGYEDLQIAISIPFRATPESDFCQSLMPEGKVQAFSLGNYTLHFRDELNKAYGWHGLLPYRTYVQKYGFPSCKILGQI